MSKVQKISWNTIEKERLSEFLSRQTVVKAGEVLVIPPKVPHSIVVPEDSQFIEFFAPVREDWLRGEDQYVRK